jgi:hypothetical protein
MYIPQIRLQIAEDLPHSWIADLALLGIVAREQELLHRALVDRDSSWPAAWKRD